MPDMLKKVLLYGLVLSGVWCGCEKAPSEGGKKAGMSPSEAAPAGEEQSWKNRLQTALKGVEEAKGDALKHVDALNEVAALYAEGMQKGWAHRLDVRGWCDSVAESGAGYSGEAVIGALFLYGNGVVRDPAMAREWFEYGMDRAGSQRGNSMYMLGLMYSSGDGVNKDPYKALDLWNKAADEDHPGSLSLLGRAYVEGQMGVDRDVAAGLSMLEKAANKGDAAASMYLGKMYSNGEGVEQNLERGMKWYEQAASRGDAHAQYIVGLAYLGGSGVPLDEQKAFNWLKLSAGQEHVNAMLMLSVCYSTGKGTRQDADMAAVWKQKALQVNQQREEQSASKNAGH